MIKISTSGKNLSLTWSSREERKEIEKVKGKIPRFFPDEDGDYVLQSYEFTKESFLDVSKISDWEADAKASDILCKVILETTKIEDLPPLNLSEVKFKKQPRDFQLKFLQVSPAKSNLLLNGSTGSGKGLMALYRGMLLGAQKILFIAPKRLVLSGKLEKEVRDCLDKEALRFWGDKKTREKLLLEIPKYDVVITTYEQAQFFKFKADFIIIDEAHLLRNTSTKKYKSVNTHLKANPKAGRLLTTATPKPNRMEGFWTVLQMVSPMLAGDKKSFLNKFQKPTRFIEVPKTLPSGLVTTFKIPVDFKEINLDELQEYVSPVVYTIPKSEIQDWEDCMEFTHLDMRPKQRDYYLQLADELWRKKREGRECILDYIMKLNQAAEGLFNFSELGRQDSNKLDYIIETIEDLEEDEKLIIWSRFKPITYLLYSKYKEKAILLNGDVSAAQVELGIFAFNGLETGEELKRYEQLQNRQKGWNFRPGEAPLCFATSSEVGSLGLDLQRYCSRQIVSVQADLWATDEQTLSRISRIGQKEKVFSEFLLSNLTTEAARLERKLEKYKSSINILEGSSSISYTDLHQMIEEIYKNAKG